MLKKIAQNVFDTKIEFLKVVILLTVSLIITVFVANIGSFSTYAARKNSSGIVDLSSWNFDKNGMVCLDGNWEFFWKKLYTNNDLKSDSIKPDIYAEIPSVWNNYKINGKNLAGFGYATYRIKVRINNTNENMALKVPTVSAAYNLYIDDKLVASNGVVGKSAKDFKPEYKQLVVNFIPQKTEFSIILQVSNFSYTRGGMWHNIKIGTSEQVNSARENSIIRDAFLIGGLFIIAIYYLNFYITRRKEKISLLFIIFCILAAIRLLIFSNINIFSYKTTVFLEYLFLCLTPALFFVLVTYTSPHRITKKVQKYLLAIAALEIAIIVIFPIHIYTQLAYVIELIDTVDIFLGMVVAIDAYIKKEPNSVITMTLCSLTVIGFSNDMLFQNNVFFHINAEISPVAVFMDIILQAFILTRKFSEAFSESEELSNKLAYALEREKEMRTQLIRMDKLKDEFLTNTSHELRTPLNGIISITESTIKGSDGPLNEMQRRNLSMVVSSGRRLTNLVNDILDLSKLKNKDIKLYKKSVDLNNSIDSVVKVFQHINVNKDVQIVFDIPSDIPYVFADENRFQQIMYNLIGNAVKFTSKGFINVYAIEAEGVVKIVVEDTGEGIPEGKRQQIWNAFEQIDSSLTRKHGGTGLGLYITKQLVELHGGSIIVESKEGVGSQFIFTLPVSNEAHDNIEEINNQHCNIDISYSYNLDMPKRIVQGDDQILVVDDDNVNLHSILNVLKLNGYSVTPVNSGVKALEELKRNRNYSLVILDVMMPEMSGYEVCRKIRENKTMYDLPILMLTANNHPESILLSFKEGANDYLSKPFESNELLARVGTLVKLKQSVSKALKMETAFLQAQIKPHFLFNVLNTIAALCEKNTEEAGELIIELANYLRASFSFSNLEDTVPIKKELDYINSYLILEKARFGDKINVEYDLRVSEGIMIPPLIIQPIVENSVRHGIRSRSEGGKVKISIKADETGISIMVWDNGKGISEDKLQELLNMNAPGKSVGLKNINMRLKRLYGSELTIISTEGLETMVSMFVPDRKYI